MYISDGASRAVRNIHLVLRHLCANLHRMWTAVTELVRKRTGPERLKVDILQTSKERGGKRERKGK